MTPCEFPEANTVYGRGQSEYLPLPAFRSDDHRVMVTSCWRMDWRERLRVLLFGRVYVSQLTFAAALQPVRTSTRFET